MNKPASSFLLPAPTSSRAFTLIELLVSAAVIALLLLLSVVGVGAMRESSRNAKCVANLRAIGGAFTSFTNENNGLYPDLVWWSDSLFPYVSRETFICQSAEHHPAVAAALRDGTLDKPDVWAGVREFISYGYNNNAFSPTANRGTKENPILWKAITPFTHAKPATMILAADCAKLTEEGGKKKAGHGYFQLEEAARQWGLPAPRHRGKANFLWADGRVTAVPCEVTVEDSYKYIPESSWTGEERN